MNKSGKFGLNEITELVQLNPQVLFVKNSDDAFAFCEKLALSHYENFPVGSIFIQKQLRKHFYSIYAFSRIADDLADENYEISKYDRINFLDLFENNLLRVIEKKEKSNNPILLALSTTIEAKKLPIEPFQKLIKAFKMDINFVQAETLDDLITYCQYSANPIGELVLRLYDNFNEETAKRAEAITSALQLLNFWQDLSRDIPSGRIYIPKNILEEYNLKNENRIDKTIQILLIYSEKLLNFGKDLPDFIKDLRLKYELKLIINGGFAILKKEYKLGKELIKVRPKLTKLDYLGILLKSILWKY